MSSRATNRQVRQRKLSTKAQLAIYREGEVELAPLDDDTTRNIPKIDTGVEKAEEIEHHLQQIIHGPQQGTTDAYIPTRDFGHSALPYDQFYPSTFKQTATYIRFSETVEESTDGPAYCMNDDDDRFLAAFNDKRKPSKRCSDLHFEHVITYLEDTAQAKQPFASVTGNAPVLGLDEFDDHLKYVDAEDFPPEARVFLAELYDYWRAQRLKRDNQPLMPTLKFERNVEADETDPYVCFRRRDHRQARKTRGRDAQVTEKMRRLRVELEQARQLMHLVKAREQLRADVAARDRIVFVNRAKVRDTKRQLGIKGDDDDLVNQKPSPKPKSILTGGGGMAHHRLPPGAQFPGQRSGGLMRSSDSLARLGGDSADYQQVEDVRHEQLALRNLYVEENKSKHRNWNTGYTDATWRPITPPMDDAQHDDYRHDDASDSERDPLGRELGLRMKGFKRIDTVIAGPALAMQRHGAGLPTPPESIASPMAVDSDNMPDAVVERPDVDVSRSSRQQQATAAFDGDVASPQPVRAAAFYRKRTGRGGRLMLDRRVLKRTHSSAFDDDSFSRPYQQQQQQQYYGAKPPPPRLVDIAASASADDVDGDEPLRSATSTTTTRTLDRFAFDRDSDDEEDEDFSERVYRADAHGDVAIRHRMVWNRNAQQDVVTHMQLQAAQQARMQRMVAAVKHHQQALMPGVATSGAGGGHS